MTPAARKMFLKPGQRALLLDAPTSAAALLKPLPDGATLARTANKPPYDWVLGFVRWQKDAQALAQRATRLVAEGGALWVAYPKQTASETTDLHRDILHRALATAGWDGVSLVALDPTWSAMRFKRAAGSARKPRHQRA